MRVGVPIMELWWKLFQVSSINTYVRVYDERHAYVPAIIVIITHYYKPVCTVRITVTVSNVLLEYYVRVYFKLAAKSSEATKMPTYWDGSFKKWKEPAHQLFSLCGLSQNFYYHLDKKSKDTSFGDYPSFKH